MRTVAAIMSASLIIFISTANILANDREIKPPRDYAPPIFQSSRELDEVLRSSINDVIAGRKDGPFNPGEIAATLIDLRHPSVIRTAAVDGERQLYPASVVKMFYLAALERQLADGKVTMTPELQRGLRDMIVDSSNEATQYILDVLTDTSSGAELPSASFVKWQYKRNRVNRFYSAMGFTNINVNQKTFCEDAYGIEQQSRGYKGQNRNMLTTDATARLLTEIVSGRMNTPERTKAMMDLMDRNWSKPSEDADSQAAGFTGKALKDLKIDGAKLWSKAGWTSRSRHDAAYVETPDGLRFVLVIFTENHANERDFIPDVAGRVIQRLRRANS
jgi:beta-lactamase class A